MGHCDECYYHVRGGCKAPWGMNTFKACPDDVEYFQKRLAEEKEKLERIQKAMVNLEKHLERAIALRNRLGGGKFKDMCAKCEHSTVTYQEDIGIDVEICTLEVCGFKDAFTYLDGELKCPNCQTILERGSDRGYETLSEHVGDPNSDKMLLRPAYHCPNSECFYFNNGFWDYSGDGLYGTKFGGPTDVGDCYTGFADRCIWKEKGERVHPAPENPLKRNNSSIRPSRLCKMKIARIHRTHYT